MFYLKMIQVCHIQQLITLRDFDRSKLFAVLNWSVNCVYDTCYFNLKYILRGLTNETS